VNATVPAPRPADGADAVVHARLQVASAATALGRVGDEQLRPLITLARLLRDAYRGGGKLLVFGNGGSAADAQHLAAEFLGRFRLERRSLPAVALTTDTSALTAIGNDFSFDEVFARQVEGLCAPGDVVLGISTSGRSPNVLRGLSAGRRAGGATAMLAGPAGAPPGTAGLVIAAPGATTAEVQAAHLVLEHLLADLVERALAGPLQLAAPGPVTDGVLRVPQLPALGAAARDQGLRVVWTNGVFDLLHPGHLALLEEAKRQGDLLVVGLNSDASVRRLKGPSRPLVDERSRAQVVGALRCVDAVCVFDEDDPRAAIAALQPQVHVKDDEYRDRAMPERDVLDRLGARVHFVPRVAGRSTTGIVSAITGPPAPG
jgi:rfaE bifunctional protein nucleotidyltransferase chain/domain